MILVYFFLLFTAIPLIELYLLIKIGGYIGALNTILLVLLTGILGAILTKVQGWQVVKRIRLEISSGKVPATALFDGFLVFIAGLLLITPGLLTDILGFLLLIPFVRYKIKMYLKNKIRSIINHGSVRISY